MSQDLSLNDLPQDNGYDYVVHNDSNVQYVNNTESRDVNGDNIYIDPIPGPAEAALAAQRQRQAESRQAGTRQAGARQAAPMYALCVAVLMLAAALVAGGILAVSRHHRVCRHTN